MIADLLYRIRAFFRRSSVEGELDDELRTHLDQQTEKYVRSGLPREEAVLRARLEFGGLDQVKEECRDSRGVNFVETLFRDIRHALRMLRRSPGFTAVTVITLALGIGANTAIFTLVDAVMLKSLPVANPKQLVRLGDNNNCCEMTGATQNGGSYVLYSYPLYKQLRDDTPEFSDLAAFTPFLTTLTVRRSGAFGPAEPYQGELVSGNYFTMFGLHAFAGRLLTARDDNPGSPPVAVISYYAWQQNFGLNPSVIGSTFVIDKVPCTVVGIAPPRFYGDTLRSDPPDFWLPLGTEPALSGQNSALKRPDVEWLYVIGRLKPGAKIHSVQARLTVELQQWLWQTGWAGATPKQRSNAALVENYRREIARQHIRLTPAGGGVNIMQTDYASGLRLLVIVAGLVLLIACANVANLLLARGAASRLNSAVRMALGAPARRLLRQSLTESVLLAALGGLAGLVVAFAGTRAILLVAFRGARYVPISAAPSWLVLGFALLLSLITGVAFGLAPALAASHANPSEALRGAGHSSGDHASFARRSLVVLQVALSAALLVGAGLLTESLRNLQGQQFGFATQGRLIVHINPKLAGYTPEGLQTLYPELQRRLARIPGVLSASLSDYSPMEGKNWNQDVYIEGRKPGDSNQDLNSSLDRVSDHYFETIGTRLLRGRVITDEDTPSSRQVAVIDQAFARKFFRNQDPIGQHFGLGNASHIGEYEIVGIVEDAKFQDARLPPYPTAFMPLLQIPAADSTHDGSIYIHDVELRLAGEPQNLEPAVRRALAEINPNLTVLGMMSLSEQVALNFNQDRLVTRLSELFGVLALLLACIGLYGVTSFSVARRTNEIGIRMALGANRGSILGLVVGAALTQIILGLAIGLPVALAGGRLLSSLLYGVKSADPVIFVVAALVLTGAALLATYIPARRATMVDPTVALRYE
ncbi:MAG TPA: ABC transporter permease [Terriglobia bacterium]|nr:ABC transporter permease [Terriglobia bacterium]